MYGWRKTEQVFGLLFSISFSNCKFSVPPCREFFLSRETKATGGESKATAAQVQRPAADKSADDSDDDDYSMYDDSDEGESSDNDDDTRHMMKFHNQLDGADDSDVSTFTVYGLLKSAFKFNGKIHPNNELWCTDINVHP